VAVVRIAGVTLPANKRIEASLPYIYGISFWSNVFHYTRLGFLALTPPCGIGVTSFIPKTLNPEP